MTDERLDVLLAQLAEVASEIATFVNGRSRAELEADLLRERGVAMSIVILAELALRIAEADPSFPSRHPDVPWAKIRGFRNHIAHNYFGIERDVIWDTATIWVPALVRSLAGVFPPQSSS